MFLPDELVEFVLQDVTDYATLTSLDSTCRQFHRLLDPLSVFGKKVWRASRCGERWPDPELIGISDYTFLHIQYGKPLCSFCGGKPRWRDPTWQFRGLRFCQSCFDHKTVNRSELLLTTSLSMGQLRVIPFVVCQAGTEAKRKAYYLKDSIPQAKPHTLNFFKLEEQFFKIRDFKMHHYMNYRKLLANKRLVSHQAKLMCADQVREYVKVNWPFHYPFIFAQSAAYTNACKRGTVLSEDSLYRLAKRIDKELAQ